MKKTNQQDADNEHNLIIRVDLGAEAKNKGGGIDFDNIGEKIDPIISNYKGAIILLSPFAPIHSGEKPFTKVEKLTGHWKDNYVQGSIYAANELFKENGEIAFNESLKGSEQKLKNLCESAEQNEAIVMYDLILNHLGSNSTQLEKLQNNFPKPIAETHAPFWDVKAFNYNDPEVRKYVFENLHKPLIDKLVDTGVKGFRIDAAGHVNLGYQKMIADYINQKATEQAQKFEIVLEHMHSDDGISKDECLKTWHRGSLNANVTTSSFLGTKLSEHEREWQNGAPKWTQDEIYHLKHRTSGMIGNHDELNLTGKVASLIATQSIMHSSYKDRISNDSRDSSILSRQLYDGNRNEPEPDKNRNSILQDTSGILTIENQIKILNGELKGKHNFAGFGEVDKERLIKIMKAKQIEIAHAQLEQNKQVMVCIGATGDFGGVLGSHSVFSKPEDFKNGKRVLDVKGAFKDLDIGPEFLDLAAAKKRHLTLGEGQWLEKVVIPTPGGDPHSDFMSVFIKHKGMDYYNNKDKIEISYACTGSTKKPDAIKELVIEELEKENRHPGRDVRSAIKNAEIYNALDPKHKKFVSIENELDQIKGTLKDIKTKNESPVHEQPRRKSYTSSRMPG
jgi:hypothetical protein